MAEAEHALLSASSSECWGACPGALAMQAGQPNPSSKYADEGTAAHELAAWCLRNKANTADYLGDSIEIADDEWHPVSEDMREFVQAYVFETRRAAADGVLLVEQRVDYSNAIGVTGQFGTSDALIVAGSMLKVRDLKYGQGVEVEAKDNSQMMLYALGAIELVEMLDLADGIEAIELTIHQPRLYAVSSHVITREQLEGFRARIALAAQLAKEYHEQGRAHVEALHTGGVIPAVLTPSESACRWCRAKAVCPALREHVLTTVANDFVDETQEIAPQLASTIDDVKTADNEQVANCLRAADLIEQWCTAIRARAESELLQGREVPGFKLVQGKRGNRAWSSEAEAEALFKSMRLKQEEMYSFKLISPTTAEKVLKESPKRWAKAAKLITQSEGKPHVAPVSDKRDALVVKPTADDFEDTSLDDLA